MTPCLPLAAAPATGALVGYLAIIVVAAFAGGASVALVSLSHRPMQVLVSLTGGVLLGVGLLHLLPHAHRALGGDIDATAAWTLAGFCLMFVLERIFHGHAHHSTDEPHACGHDHHHEPGPAAPHPAAAAGRWAWCGAFAGLGLHSLADGAALAASVQAEAPHGGPLAGLATFLAILLHKPFDAAIIAMLMIAGGASAATRRFANVAYAALVPLGAAVFLTVLPFCGRHEPAVLGVAMAMAAGAFLCVAAADLLPEVQFHTHDRTLLTAALAMGLSLAWGITVLERAAHGHGPPARPAESRSAP